MEPFLAGQTNLFPTDSEAYQRYALRLKAFAEKHIARKWGDRIPAEEVVQSALGSFFHRMADGDYRIDHSGALWQLLVTIVLNKIRKKTRQCREELPEAGFDPPDSDAPLPDEEIQLTEEIECLLAGLERSYGEILTLRLEGFGIGEIAERIGCSRWTVRRTLNRLAERLERRMEDSRAG